MDKSEQKKALRKRLVAERLALPDRVVKCDMLQRVMRIWLVNRPKPYLIAFILAVVFSGVYSIDQSVFDLGIVLAAGVLGYGLRYFGVSTLPVVLGVVLGYMVESNYRRSLVLSSGDPLVFLENPISLGLLLTAAALLIYSLIRERRKAAT